MNNFFIKLGRIIVALFGIFTIILMIMFFIDVDNNFILKFAKIYIALIYLFAIYSIIALIITFRSLKWKKTSKLLFKWAIWAIALWLLGVLYIYFTKGELRLTYKIFTAITVACGTVFGPLILGSSEYD